MKIATLALATFTAFTGGTAALAQSDFYRGKQLKIVVGSEAGGGFSSYSLLLSAYLASKGHVLDDTHLSIADGMTAGWRAAVLQQLRQVRRRLPKFAEEVPEEDRKNVKEKILEAELAAEQVAHRLIFKRLDDAPMPTDGGSVKDRAEKNLKLYLRRLVTQGGGPGAPDERDFGDVSSIVAAL